MSTAWLDELLPKAIVSPRFRILWLVFFLLFPLAYLGGVMLETVEERPAQMQNALDRTLAIKAAQKFAESKGISVAGWSQYVVVENHDKLLEYYENVHRPELAAIRKLAPAREINVLFRSPDLTKDFHVYLSLAGPISGFDTGKFSNEGNADIDIGAGNIQIKNDKTSAKGTTMKAASKEAETIALRFLVDGIKLNDLVQLGPPTRVDVNEDDPRRTDVTWEVSPPDDKELTLHVSVAVRDSQVVAERITGQVDGDKAKFALPKTSKLSVFLNSIYGLFLTFSLFYAIFRYAKRTFQKEVSHLRTLVVAGLFCVSYSVYAYSLAVDEVATRVSAHQFASIQLPAYVSAVLAFAVMGLLVGIAYGSGEGEVREAYPGRLTPLDALLAGRIFSRDVSASVLAGAAAAGWLLLCQHGLGYFLPTDMEGTPTEGLKYTFARLPWLTLLVGRQWQSLLIAVAGLLLPAAFLLRSKSRGKRRFVWLVVFALCAVLHEGARYSTVPEALLAMGVLVCALLLPFFAFDLLAAIVSLSALAFVNELVELSAVFPSWTAFAAWLAGLAAAVLAIATYLALRGAPVREEDVQPLYAKNLAERMGLQAEVQAAREAQLRLLPQMAPQMPGIEFAACCLPARGVGGDFYDFFQLDANRIGIFVAQGGERGLASALCIALAKGILMHASQQTHSAAQIVRQLESGMTKLLQGGREADISFIYGVMDSQRRMLNYARVGVSPRVLVHRRDSGFANAANLERRAEFVGRHEKAFPILEGATNLGPGDHLIFFTEGVASLRLKRFRNRANQWLELLMHQLGQPHESLQTVLASTLEKYQSHASEDLTAVVLRATGREALEREGVA